MDLHDMYVHVCMYFRSMRRDMGDMITALDAYLCPGSHLTLFNHVPLEQREARLRQGYRTIDPVNVTIEHVSTALYCTVLYCTVLHCTALHCGGWGW